MKIIPPLSKEVNDRLTRRERALYRAIHGVALAIAVLGFVWYLVLNRSETSYIEAWFFWVTCIPVVIFGYALRSNTRVIHGIKWLRSE
jgi:hypothetical protein